MRIHGTIQARPAEVFAEHDAPALLPVPAGYDVPVFTAVKVHRDFHVEVAKALYSVPGDYLGQQLDARADSSLIKLYHRGKLVKTHPRQSWTDPGDVPAQKTGYALHRLIATCAGHGENIGIYAERVVDDPLPWTRMRALYRLLGLVRRYGAERVETACARALDLDVISVTEVASMLGSPRRLGRTGRVPRLALRRACEPKTSRPPPQWPRTPGRAYERRRAIRPGNGVRDSGA